VRDRQNGVGAPGVSVPALLSQRLSLLFGCLTACATAGTAPPEQQPAPDAPKLVDAPPPIDAAVSDCASAATCQAAMPLGTVSGDTGNMKLSAMGHQAAWFRVRVTEDDSEPFGLTLRVAAKLTSPASANYDVFVFLNEGADVVECALSAGSATSAGNVDENRAEWGEGSVANGSNDGRDVSIEVRPISGACDASAPWQLEVEGNWL
jgi:hypothetical protein